MKVCSACKRCFDEPADTCIESDHPVLLDLCGGGRLMVPGYSLDQLIGTGVKAYSFRARRLDCGRSCLITIVSTDVNGQERFLHDAQLIATLFDARVADIYEAGTLTSGECFVVEEDDAAPTLRQRLDAAGVPDLLSTVRIAEQAAEALHALHVKGLTHGAVRPENIHLEYDADGLPILKLSGIDLGGVVASNAISNKFLIDSALDAIKYFAPEQCSGESATLRSDIYSLGVVFYELLAGVPPFDAPRAAALINLHKSQRPPEVKIDDLELRMLVTHSLSESLQKQPSFRQSSADLFARQMRLIEQLATHVSTPPPAMSVPAGPQRSHPVAIANPSPIPTPAPLAKGNAHAAAFAPAPRTEHAYISAEGSSETTAGSAEPAPPIEPISQTDLGPDPVEQTAPDELTEPEFLLTLTPTTTTAETPPSTPSALTSHRHRHRLWKKRYRTGAETLTRRIELHEIISLGEAEPSSAVTPEISQAASSPAVRTSGEEFAAPIASPKLIKWEQPDDIPSLDEFPDEAACDPPPPAPLVPAPELEAPALHAETKPQLIEWEQPEDDIPSLEDVLEVQAKEGIGGSALRFQPEDPGLGPDVQFEYRAELGETPKTAFDCEENLPLRVASAVDFVPTILERKRERKEAVSLQPYGSIFAADEGVEQISRHIPYRSILIGIGLMSLAALLGLRGDPVWRFISSAPKSGEPVTAALPTAVQSVPVRRTPPAIVEPTDIESDLPDIPDYEPRESYSERPSASNGPEPARSKRLPARTRTSTPNIDTPVNAPAQTANIPFEPSTVVITYGKGNVQRSDRPENRAAERSSRPAPDRTAGATRPRVVAVPR